MCKAEREGSGLLYKIIKDLYQIISKLSEHQEVTDIIWYDILFIDNLGSNTPWKKVGQAVGQILGGSKIPTLFHNLWGFEKICTFVWQRTHGGAVGIDPGM